MNTNMTRFRQFSKFQKSLHSCALDESILSIGTGLMFVFHNSMDKQNLRITILDDPKAKFCGY